MNKKGFIATSLIYSFFLIFVTLFLGIIADYLQNKVLLNTIEKGIKDELNTTMNIIDFEVGDMVRFVDSCENTGGVTNIWVVAKIDTTKNDEKVIFYSYNFMSEPFASASILEYEDLEKDIELDYRNETYLNKILYTFNTIDASGEDITEYSLGSENKVSTECNPIGNGVFDVENNCVLSGTSSNSRYRYKLDIRNQLKEKCNVKDSSIIYLKV